VSRAGFRNKITDKVRTWAKSVLNISDGQVVRQYDDRPKPNKPFLVVFFITHFRQIGAVEWEMREDPSNADVIQTRIVSQRESTLQISGFGDKTVDWLEQLELSLAARPTRKTLWDEKINIRTASEISDDTSTVQNRYEIAQTQDYNVNYMAITSWVDWSKAAKTLDLQNSYLREFPDQADADALDLTFDIAV